MRHGFQIQLDVENKQVIVTLVDRDNDNEVIATRAFNATRIHESLRGHVGLYGLSKLITDRTSDISVKTEGLAKLDAMEEVLARFESGEWTAERKAGAPTVSVEIEALARLKKTTIAAIQKTLQGYSKEQRQGILNHPKIQEIAAQIAAERSTQPEVDLSDLA